jgi:hypothetical protein
VPDAWSRAYPSGHRARITKSFERTYSLEVFTASGDRLLDFALLLPSLELAQETADYVVNAQGEPWIATTADEASDSPPLPPTVRRTRRSP